MGQNNPLIEIKRLPQLIRLDNKFPLPNYETIGSAGMDLRVCQAGTIQSREIVSLPTGIAIAVPHGWEVQIRSRSGLALKKGIVVVNSPGTVDSDYRGEIKLILTNITDSIYHYNIGDRLAQMVVSPVGFARLLEVEELNQTDRDIGGFGSTGI